MIARMCVKSTSSQRGQIGCHLKISEVTRFFNSLSVTGEHKDWIIQSMN